jgi:hypothetical protein
MANNSPQVSQLRAIQDRANNSPQFSKTAQFQAMANQHQNSPVTQFVLPALGGAVRRLTMSVPKRVGSMINTANSSSGVKLASTAIKLGTAAASVSEIHNKLTDKKETPKIEKNESPEEKDNREKWEKYINLFDIGREGVGVVLSLGPFGELSTAYSFANNIYDKYEKTYEKNGLEAFKAAFKAAADGFSLIIGNNAVSNLINFIGDSDKLFGNRDNLKIAFRTVVEEVNGIPDWFTPDRENNLGNETGAITPDSESQISTTESRQLGEPLPQEAVPRESGTNRETTEKQRTDLLPQVQPGSNNKSNSFGRLHPGKLDFRDLQLGGKAESRLTQEEIANLLKEVDPEEAENEATRSEVD